MAIINTVSEYEFCDAFRLAGRPDNFSYEGRKALYEYLEQLSEDIDENIDFDVIAICCDYYEYDSLADFQEEYGREDYQTLEDISNATTLIEIPCEAGFIIQGF